MALKMDGWNTRFLFGWPIFRCYVSFRECRWWFQNILYFHPETWGRCSPHFDYRIFFQMGGKKHQLDNHKQVGLIHSSVTGVNFPSYWGPCPPSPLPCWSWIPTNVQLHERHGSPSCAVCLNHEMPMVPMWRVGSYGKDGGWVSWPLISGDDLRQYTLED